MTQDEQIKLRLMADYINKAAEYGVGGATDGRELSLETLDLAVSYLRRVRSWWLNENQGAPVELTILHADALSECITDLEHSRHTFIETEFLRLMARPTREGHVLDGSPLG